MELSVKLQQILDVCNNHQHVIKIYGTKKTLYKTDLGPRIFSKRDPFKGIKMKQDKNYIMERHVYYLVFLKE